MKFKLYFILPVLSLILFSCGGEEKGETSSNFYDLKEFVNGQIHLLTALKPVVKKKMKVGEETEETKTTTIDWEKELELFVKADLNKPVNSLIYDTKQDSLGVTYTLKAGEDAPVRFLKIVNDPASGNPLSIEAKVNTNNKLYESEKNLLLKCGEVKGQWRIQSYHISGFQDLVISDRKPFEIEAVVE